MILFGTFRSILLILRRVLAFAVLWLVLAGTGPTALLAGVPVVAVAAWLSLRLLPLRPLSVLRALAFLPGFALRSVLGGIDVARRAFHPALPLDPGWLRLPVALSPGGRVVLGAELSLMPGTLVAGSSGGDLLIHVLDRGQDVRRAVADEAARIGALQGRP